MQNLGRISQQRIKKKTSPQHRQLTCNQINFEID